MPRSVSSQVSPPHSTVPCAGARPAIARSSVVLPAPDGPAIARQRPGSTASPTSSSAAWSIAGGELDADEDGGADREQDDRERDRAVEVDRETLVDREWCGLRDSAQRPGEHQRRAELAERPAPG